MNNVKDLYNELCYIYKDKYNEEEFNLNKKNKKNFDYKKLRLTDNYYESEDEKASQPGGLVLPKWIKTSEKRFNEILRTVTKAKNNGLKISVGGREITPDKVESLLKDVGSGKINRHEFKEKCNDIMDDVISILDKSEFTRNKENMIEIL